MPNLLILLADQFRHDCAGYRNMRPVKTPHIDSLAADGAVFTRAFTPLPVCAPMPEVREPLTSCAAWW